MTLSSMLSVLVSVLLLSSVGANSNWFDWDWAMGIIQTRMFLMFTFLRRSLYVTSWSTGWICWDITTPTTVNLFPAIFMEWFMSSATLLEWKLSITARRINSNWW